MKKVFNKKKLRAQKILQRNIFSLNFGTKLKYIFDCFDNTPLFFADSYKNEKPVNLFFFKISIF